jgi:hypothetical protein
MATIALLPECAIMLVILFMTSETRRRQRNLFVNRCEVTFDAFNLAVFPG